MQDFFQPECLFGRAATVHFKFGWQYGLLRVAAALLTAQHNFGGLTCSALVVHISTQANSSATSMRITQHTDISVLPTLLGTHNRKNIFQNKLSF